MPQTDFSPQFSEIRSESLGENGQGRVAVVGGGITGLATALRLCERGRAVTLFESSDRLGGLATTFSVGGSEFEKFYHCLLPSDSALLRLVADVGLQDDVLWRETRMGFMVRGRLYPLNTPLDLLRFRPLGLVDRLRLAALAAWARRRGSDPRLDEVSAAEWIRGFAGERAYRTVWEPLLRAKLGSAAADVPALWITSRLQREKNTARERKGVLRGGYRSLIDAIARRVRALGGELRLSTPVDAVELARGGVRIGTGGAAAEDFEFAVCTTPLPHFQGLSEGLPIDPRVRERKLDYQGVVCGVLFLDRAISPYYWTPFVDSGATAQGVVEMSNLMPLARSAGRHVNYFVNYCHRESELFQSADDALLGRYRDDLASLYPNSGASVLEAHLFRAPFVEPMWTRGSLAARPPYEAIAGRLYSVSTSQLYPRVNSWNSCCELVEELMLGLPVSGASAP